MKGELGEITTAVVILIAAGSLLAGFVLPKLNPLKHLFVHESAAGKKASFTLQKEHSKPVFYESKDGKKVAVGKEVELTYSTGMEQTTPKATLGQRIASFFASLTGWGIALVGGSLAFFGGAPLVWLGRKYFIVKQALKNTVSAIRKIPAETYEAEVKPLLAAEHDKQDRKVIDKIKTELN